MKVLGKYWKLLLAIVLVAAALLMYYGTYKNEEAAYTTKTQQLKTMIQALENSIRENSKYVDVQDDLEEANAKIVASRMELYEHFPVEMKEEDQIMYVLYLEKLFGTEIFFSFGTKQPLMGLRDGSTLLGLTLTVNYETTYEGFKDMLDYLSTDSRITSVQYADIQYDAKEDKATGTITLLLYLLETAEGQYAPPDVAIPDTGKDNIYE